MPDEPRQTPGNRLRFLTTSAEYYEALAACLAKAQHRILIVGWSFDDRVVLTRDAERPRKSVGDLLLECAARRPELLIQLRIWEAPPMFGADQYLSQSFRDRVAKTENLDLRFVPLDSAFAGRHEKYVLIDSVLAFLGGIDVTHSRWDRADHKAKNAKRTNPQGERYVPYHDVQIALSGPVVGELWRVATGDGIVETAAEPMAPEESWWPPDLPVDAEDAVISLVRTRLDPHTDKTAVSEIRDRYLDLIGRAQTSIYIENQYFSSAAVTDAIINRVREPHGPDVVIIMSKRLPDTLGRMTMGTNNSVQLSRLLNEDAHGKVTFFSRVAPDDPDTTVKVHSKLMIIDSRVITLGSANISRRSFRMDSELNMIIDAHDSDNHDLVRQLEARLCAQHCGLSTAEWIRLVADHDGSVPAALKARAADWPGLRPGKLSLDTTHLPAELIEKLDMDKPPQAESAMQRLVQANPGGIRARIRQGLLVVLALALVSAAAVLFVRIDIDMEAILESVRQIYRTRPVLGIALTIGSYWLSIALFVTIVVPIVFFAALHGPLLGILFSIAGLFSGAAVYYRLGLLVYDANWVNRFKAIRVAKEQLERIKPYGVWAVAISRMVPSGPFAVVNFVTGMLGFTWRQFLVGSLIGLLPGIVAFSLFGEIIQNVFTDPGWTNIALLAGFLVVYFTAARLLLGLIRKIAGWATGDGDE